MLLHSPIRDVYLCIQGFDSRLACRICNNTVQSRIRADGPSAHWERRRRGGKNVKGRKGSRKEAQGRKDKLERKTQKARKETTEKQTLADNDFSLTKRAQMWQRLVFICSEDNGSGLFHCSPTRSSCSAPCT